MVGRSERDVRLRLFLLVRHADPLLLERVVREVDADVVAHVLRQPGTCVRHQPHHRFRRHVQPDWLRALFAPLPVDDVRHLVWRVVRERHVNDRAYAAVLP